MPVYYDIIDQHGVISKKDYDKKSYIKEINTISWNDGHPMIDIRTWIKYDGSKTYKAGKGITLNENEARKLKKILDKMFD